MKNNSGFIGVLNIFSLFLALNFRYFYWLVSLNLSNIEFNVQEG